jgi:hypothetical protein
MLTIRDRGTQNVGAEYRWDSSTIAGANEGAPGSRAGGTS